jgi:hypothetical protein
MNVRLGGNAERQLRIKSTKKHPWERNLVVYTERKWLRIKCKDWIRCVIYVLRDKSQKRRRLHVVTYILERKMHVSRKTE